MAEDSVKNEGIYDDEKLLDVKLWYTTDHVGGFSCSIEGMASAHNAYSRPFEITFTDDWYDEFVIVVDDVCIKRFKDDEEEEAM